MQLESALFKSPDLLKIKTVGDKEHFINRNMIVSMSNTPESNSTDILLLNGQKYVVSGDAETNAKKYSKTVNEMGKNLDLMV